MTHPLSPIYNPWDLPFSRGGWRCDSCGKLLAQADSIGRYAGPIFKVLGYYCPSCHHEVRKEPVLDAFNWKLLIAGRSSCL